MVKVLVYKIFQSKNSSEFFHRIFMQHCLYSRIPSSIIYFLFFIFLSGCNKEKDTTIPLPSYESDLVVECYLEPGKPYKLLLTESVSYFDVPSMPKVADAVVTITHKGVTDTLKYFTFVMGTTDTSKVFNFVGDKIVVSDGEPYLLNIKDKKGREVSGVTTLMPVVIIDSIQFNGSKTDSLGYIISYIKDDKMKNNFYRYIVLNTMAKNTYSIQELLFEETLSTANSAIIKVGNSIMLKSPNRLSNNFNKKNTYEVILYHIEEAYYKYLRSIKDARDANGNPFAQPPGIKSNVQGGKGIFTGLSEYRKVIVTPE